MGEVVFVGMAGKIAKLAAGVTMTHFQRSEADTELLAKVAGDTGAPEPVRRAARATATARHFCEAGVAACFRPPLTELCRLAALARGAHVRGRLVVDVVMVDDYEGRAVLAFPRAATEPGTDNSGPKRPSQGRKGAISR